MPDRRRRTTSYLLPRERQSTDDNNPFAPPPEGRPDQPWQPRHPGNGDGSSGQDPSGAPEGDRPAWGSQWSPDQPGRSSGGFGGRPGGDQQGGGPGGPGGPAGPGGKEGKGLRWDPTDPSQRRARYALLSGMWAFFFAIFDFPEIALLLGALGVYWAISSLRGKPGATSGTPEQAAQEAVRQNVYQAMQGGPQQTAAPGATAPGTPPVPAPGSGRPQTTAAVSGLVTAALALTIVAATFTVQLVYRDYYTCVDDALTKTGQLSCNELLPTPLRDVFGVQE
ncbi:hypothetical protein [Streptomyces sp. SP18CS02]|uniref:hypothetical protein n=1 Tax=Streptomyces sp. SP18CS02 TaxID=3002531 RepID=UPI002E7A5202|nr:hypothetical protein [Streptomyces sp. SP18CS02]MEE1756120.1 hypothetical protein [Streptomyces sp. SP18CS02]